MSLPRANLCNLLNLCYKQNYSLNPLRAYSRRSDSKTTSASYKNVKNTTIINDTTTAEIQEDLNWELLAPRGYRFLLPGAVGAACQGVSTTWAPEGALQKLVNIDEKSAEKLDITTSQCPVLLQKSLLQMFPSSTINRCTNFTVATLHKNLSQREFCDLDTEKIAMMFVYAAQELCTRLILSGYWADFINPFSGKPYNGTESNNNININNYNANNIKLYEPDEQFLCSGFSINDIGKKCTIISKGGDMDKYFKGNIFTDAPSHLETFLDIVKNYDLQNFK